MLDFRVWFVYYIGVKLDLTLLFFTDIDMRRFIYDALWTRFEYCKTCGRSDSRFDNIFEQYATCIAECGLGDNKEVTASVIVDNWCINGRGDTYKGRLYDRYHLRENEDKREK